MKLRLPHLYLQVLVAIGLGVAVGWLEPAWGASLKVLGDGFIQLIKMLIAPIIFATVVAGIGGLGNLRQVGRVGMKALVYFELVTTAALALGLVVARVFTPGAGLHAAAAALDGSAVAQYAGAAKSLGAVDFLLHLIPRTFVGAFVEGDILQVLVVAVLFGLALAGLGEHGRPIVNGLNNLARVFFGMVTLVTRLAPLAAFGAMAFTVGKYGLSSLASLAGLLACVYLTCLLFIVLVLGGIARAGGFSLWKLLHHLREELLIVLGTSSSEAATSMPSWGRPDTSRAR